MSSAPSPAPSAPVPGPAHPSRLKQPLGALVLFVAICLFCGTALGELFHGVMLGSLVFVFWRLVIVRGWICRHHRMGLALYQDERFADALVRFQKSDAWWSRVQRLDHARGIMLGCTGPWSFSELAVFNQACCLHQLARYKESRALIDAVITRCPAMRPARTLRRALQAPDRPASAEGWGDLGPDQED